MKEKGYLNKVKKLFDRGDIPKGSISIANIYHDNGCTIWEKGVCNCNPDLNIASVDQNKKK